MAKTALICGISGQDGAYLAELLLAKGYTVVGTSRDAQQSRLSKLERLGLRDRVSVVSMTPKDFRSVLQALSRAAPDEVYNLAGQSSVGLSFELPVETHESVSLGTLNLLEAIRFLGAKKTRFYNAGSGESFGATDGRAVDEQTRFRPRSPYAVAKAAAHWQVASYREAYSLFACSGLLFNHESPLRPERFVTRKIVAAACRIAGGAAETLTLGNIDIERDWGWAPEYVDAMWRMLQRDEADDFIVSTGVTHSLRDFIAAAFAALDLDWQQHVEQDQRFFRPSEIKTVRTNPGKAKRLLGWEATVHMPEVARRMVEAERGWQAKRTRRRYDRGAGA